nr:helix-hairpin-helix domain-containing protein [Caldimonas mangrovi]
MQPGASLELIPNIGSALADDLQLIGIQAPRDLIGRDAFVLYQELCAKTGQRHDPCVLDTFMAAIDFMRGAPAAPWWHYTAQRKLLYGQGRPEGGDAAPDVRRTPSRPVTPSG